MVAAAFIGPGTVTTATVAGAEHGYVLVWALVFAVLAALVLQEMSARLGVVGGMGLGEAMRRRFDQPLARAVTTALVLGAILIGNAAYETGNLLGGALGLESLLGGSGRFWGPALGALAFALLWTGRYRWVERALVLMVAVMGIVFLTTAVALGPDLGDLLGGLVPSGLGDRTVLLTALGLVGTTVVPYNLFLHASAAHERWPGPGNLPAARGDTAVSVTFGGLISIGVLVSAAALPAATGVVSAGDMAQALEPLLGRWAGAFFACGLLAAGLSSAITAPLAAAYATCGVMGWDAGLRSSGARAVWIPVLLAGVFFSLLAVRPVPAIIFAQAANGLLLPVVAGFLLYVANDHSLLGDRSNGIGSNVLAGAMVLLAAALGVRSLVGALAGL
ncbi:MAG: divalent metal cation transporter [Gemmatimonadetes bacterium]|uniref:Divalent metal cation transporter n=1 Tax=Candidatus Kutchimonas denitrificans TaxID=3056748 RepID=A0AAE5C834_9BACT|nr:divalent metal cation transporter [Gemmatimonadota bacterium]NIR74131.1 divalent metal cation transporter [Candidatus Kutchimonas denitrificans]NIS01313.1 divalent metal cation transporter [Gemmatimonadota bacterium]NIT67044.1 divalent metal cation transporter [Gemmatimonadota bacterium]NIU51704.1 divalent metal cation transporter [Gemmatimonadota bacterium]